MTAVAMPARTWGKAEPAAPRLPTVLVSSRDGHEVPKVAAAVRLAKVAEAAGWTVRQTYALARVPATSRKDEHLLHSVAVRLARGGVRGWAVWHREGDGAWRFACAQMARQSLGAKQLPAVLAA